MTDIPFDIIVGAGQSNSLQSDDPLRGVRDVDDRIWTWEGGRPRRIEPDETYLLPEFARAYVEHLPPSRHALIVSCGEGATGFTTSSLDPVPDGYQPGVGTWDRTLTSDPCNLYERMISRVTAALAFSPESRLVCMLWSQGESDCIRDPHLDELSYSDRLDDLIEQLRKDLVTLDLPVVIGSMVPEWYEQSPERMAVASALARTPERLPRTGFVWGPVAMPKLDEPIHWSTQAQFVRGAGMAKEGLMEALVNQVLSAPIGPGAFSATRAAGTLTVRWSRPLCRVTDVRVEAGESVEGPWVPVRRDLAHGSRAIVSDSGSASFARLTIANDRGRFSSVCAIIGGSR